jgi:4-hydroxythreonine-4-phosphate dehydrogenase
MGDPAGIGPEIIVKALMREEPYRCCSPVVIGDGERLLLAAGICGFQGRIVRVRDLREAVPSRDSICCFDLPIVPGHLAWGEISAEAGEAAFRFLECAIRLTMEGDADAICTAPISKAALHRAGHRYPGHTEILAQLTGTEGVSLMLVSERLRIIHVTAHVGLAEAIERIDPDMILRTIERGVTLTRRLGVPVPRVGVCGINPHAGEDGLFGRGEEERVIQPAVVRANDLGWNVGGPYPADALLYRTMRGEFDLVVAMYHDQGHAPFKVLGIETGVNVTAGLPIVRTSVDHGTAFDLAGKGIANEQSLLCALAMAARLALRA